MSIEDLDLPRDSQGFIHLRKKYSELWQKTTYLTKEPYIIDRVYEYDIKAANVSSLLTAGYDSKALETLLKLPKKTREVAIGKMIRQDKKIGKLIKKEITRAREQLFRSNSLIDTDIVSIKNDAVFVRGRSLEYTTFGHMEFRLKNQYAAFVQFDKLELYYNRRKKTVDIKGVNDEVVQEQDHQNGIIKFLVKVMEFLVMDRRDALRKYLIEFSHEYKARELPVVYYRELNTFNVYRTIYELAGYSYDLTMVDQKDVKMINIVYNYLRYVLPMIRMFI